MLMSSIRDIVADGYVVQVDENFFQQTHADEYFIKAYPRTC